MELRADTLQTQIPYYLTQEAKENLVKALNNFPKITYYTSLYPNDALQGDGWTSLGIVSFEKGERDFIKGIILSNSCDIDLTNKRDLPAKLIFAPIIKLTNYIKLLEKADVPKSNIATKIQAIRTQHVTTLFYLPKEACLDAEYIALLDDIHTIPLSTFNSKDQKKLFTLSQVGFYLFIFKLSVHFCRFHENIDRNL